MGAASKSAGEGPPGWGPLCRAQLQHLEALPRANGVGNAELGAAGEEQRASTSRGVKPPGTPPPRPLGGKGMQGLHTGVLPPLSTVTLPHRSRAPDEAWG